MTRALASSGKADGRVRIVGVYVPSRDATLEKTERKKTWLERFQAALDATASTDVPLLVLGDLNVLEPGHTPAHAGQFAQFEYDFYADLTHRHGLIDLFRHLHPERIERSWARRPELGYRYDHAHGSRALAERLTSCEYLHQTRTALPDGSRLTDHSGLAVRVTLTAARATANVRPDHSSHRAGRTGTDTVLTGGSSARRLPQRSPADHEDTSQDAHHCRRHHPAHRCARPAT